MARGSMPPSGRRPKFRRDVKELGFPDAHGGGGRNGACRASLIRSKRARAWSVVVNCPHADPAIARRKQTRNIEIWMIASSW